MIIKSYEVNKISLIKENLILFYGKNEGSKKDTLLKLIEKKDEIEIFNFDEKQILQQEEVFFNEILSKSLFEKEKIIVIKNCTDKITKVILEIINKGVNDIPIILYADTLEKRSKLRSLFEKEKKLVCVPFYQDNNLTLSKFAQNFLNAKKIPISQSDINLIINRSNGDREHLRNALEKVELFSLNKKIITTDELNKLTNLVENHGISELLDYCLVQNKKKVISILNENNFTSDECISIIRILLNKTKKILNLSIEFQKCNNIDQVISAARPPIFWKDKEIIKSQIEKWKPDNIRELIYDIFKIELEVKKNINISIILITNFLLNLTSTKTNN